jgi:hypothetical protein
MIKERILNVHRRIFGRCQRCGRRMRSDVPRIFEYEWAGWGHSEVGLWHLGCLERHLKRKYPDLPPLRIVGGNG